jgi:hypothetical protein
MQRVGILVPFYNPTFLADSKQLNSCRLNRTLECIHLYGYIHTFSACGIDFKARNVQDNMTRMHLRHLAFASLILFGSLVCWSMSAQQTAGTTQSNPTAAAVAATVPLQTTVIEQAAPPDAPGFAASSSVAMNTEATTPDESTPDAPALQSGSQSGNQEPEHTDGQTKRILGIIPNFRAVSANVKLPPQSVKDKFVTASQDSFDYSSIVLPAVIAAYDLERNATPEFGHGGVGYGRYLWHSAVDQTSENYWVEFIVPAITHEDTRYYTLGSGGFLKRTGYALSRAVITRDDAGKEVFNAGEVFGAGAAAGMSNLYYPSAERTFGNTADQWGLDVGIDAATFWFKEFWPDINHKLFHGDNPFKNATQAPQQ